MAALLLDDICRHSVNIGGVNPNPLPKPAHECPEPEEYREADFRVNVGTITTHQIEQLMQIAKGPVWDGNLISKTARKQLVEAGYVEQINGWNILTSNGAIVAINLGMLKA